MNNEIKARPPLLYGGISGDVAERLVSTFICPATMENVARVSRIHARSVSRRLQTDDFYGAIAEARYDQATDIMTRVDDLLTAAKRRRWFRHGIESLRSIKLDETNVSAVASERGADHHWHIRGR